MRVRATTAAAPEAGADTVVVGLFEGEGVAHDHGGVLQALVDRGEARPATRKLAVAHADGIRYVLVGLGARSEFDAEGARAAAWRMIGWSVALGAAFGAVLLALVDVLPHAFTDDPRVVERAHAIWWIFALTMPANAAVFALDGILIGAGDTRFLMWGMLAAAAVYVPVALLALDQGWGIQGVWFGLAGLIAVRLATCGGRFVSSRWALTGAPATV
jgi:hypothetical protein